MTAIAVLLAAAAAALYCAPKRRLPAGPPGGLLGQLPGSRPGDHGAGPALLRPGRRSAAVGAVVTGALIGGFDGRHLVLGLIVAGAVSVATVLWRRGREASRAEDRQAQVVEVCEGLVGELRSGQPLVRSLERCVELWPTFEPVAAAARLGADVPGALRDLARHRGAEGLREVASAWQVSQQSGAGLAVALGQVAASARSRQSTRRLVRAELASAQATARLVALLPLMALAMGHGIGGDPVGFLLNSPLGLGALATGTALAAAGLLWIDRIAAGVLHR